LEAAVEVEAEFGAPGEVEEDVEQRSGCRPVAGQSAHPQQHT
jgi:hypothetical protein